MKIYKFEFATGWKEGIAEVIAMTREQAFEFIMEEMENGDYMSEVTLDDGESLRDYVSLESEREIEVGVIYADSGISY